jgi:anti-sigma factor RsiW
MTEETDKSEAGAELWARAREGWRAAAPRPEAPDSLTLAAYLDGTLDEAALERVEAWMTASPEALDLMISARSAQAAAPEAAPDGLMSRAQGLVRARPRAARAGLGAWLSGLIGFQVEAWRPVAWAGVTAALLVVSTGGFELGRLGALQLVPVQTAASDDLGFGLSDPADELL